MGYMRHHGMLVTTWDRDRAVRARDKAVSLRPNISQHARVDMVSEIAESHINGYCSFAIFPDGSKEDWPESDAGDEFRREFIEWLDSQRYDDGSSPYDWVLVQYGDDNQKTRIVRNSDEEQCSPS